MTQAQDVIELIINKKKLSHEKRLRELIVSDQLAARRADSLLSDCKRHGQSVECSDLALVSESEAHVDSEPSLQCIASVRRADRSLHQDLSRHEGRKHFLAFEDHLRLNSGAQFSCLSFKNAVPHSGIQVTRHQTPRGSLQPERPEWTQPAETATVK
ncbi:hypothetical protein AJ78_08907 [Emergomyces pasteurianus Ep9510]|uniref:Uncharacterized protein n=1 Tax=Emergomyces pasteurianus Ep9510 TaxID=1447872 RepID=A0A1J9P0E8_9EURO|nr:hypothetical protein AJ78_08907 [Emergomyces pasteurianus Ep9510]